MIGQRNSAVWVMAKHILISGIALVMLYPVLWMLGSSFKPGHMIFTETWFWPREWNFQNYMNGWTGIRVTHSPVSDQLHCPVTGCGPG